MHCPHMFGEGVHFGVCLRTSVDLTTNIEISLLVTTIMFRIVVREKWRKQQSRKTRAKETSPSHLWNTWALTIPCDSKKARMWEENKRQVTAPPCRFLAKMALRTLGSKSVESLAGFLTQKGFSDEVVNCLEGMVLAFLVSCIFLRF